MSWTYNFCFKKKINLKFNLLLTANLNTVAIRFPKHRITRSILKKLNFPLAMPSANLSSGISPVNALLMFQMNLKKKLKSLLIVEIQKLGLSQQ